MQDVHPEGGGMTIERVPATATVGHVSKCNARQRPAAARYHRIVETGTVTYMVTSGAVRPGSEPSDTGRSSAFGCVTRPLDAAPTAANIDFPAGTGPLNAPISGAKVVVSITDGAEMGAPDGDGHDVLLAVIDWCDSRRLARLGGSPAA
jgi:hypothetical protein